MKGSSKKTFMSFIKNIDKAIEMHKRPKGAGEFHNVPFSAYIGDLVYGANDGIITTFAVVAGVSGADLDVRIVIILGCANLVADGVSMAFGNYLGTKSDQELARRLREEEEWEVANIPDYERKEIEDIYKAKGFEGRDLERAVDIITSDKKRWVEVMMKEEHAIFADENPRAPIKNAFATLVAFVGAGAVPLLPYFFIRANGNLFAFSIIFTAAALFTVGALRSFIIKKMWVKAGAEMLIVGAIAAGIAYFIGEAMKHL